MAVLYGNEVALKSARNGLAYPGGAVLVLVRWNQQDDHHWFGGRIPKSIASEEVVGLERAGSRYIRYTAIRA